MARPEHDHPLRPRLPGATGSTSRCRSSATPCRGAALRAGEVLDYTHYSLVMHAGAARGRLHRPQRRCGRGCVGVGGRHPWQMDERVGDPSLAPRSTTHNRLDRGHLVRREDVSGVGRRGRAANKATYFYTNAAPQHENFNQDEWVALEDWVLHRGDRVLLPAAASSPARCCGRDDPTLDDLPPNLRAAFHARGPVRSRPPSGRSSSCGTAGRRGGPRGGGVRHDASRRCGTTRTAGGCST